MNEDRCKLKLSKRKQLHHNNCGNSWFSYYVKPTGKFWKRYFNKKVRQGSQYKGGNWLEWS